MCRFAVLGHSLDNVFVPLKHPLITSLNTDYLCCHYGTYHRTSQSGQRASCFSGGICMVDWRHVKWSFALVYLLVLFQGNLVVLSLNIHET